MKANVFVAMALLTATVHCGRGSGNSSKVLTDAEVGSVVTIAGYAVTDAGIAIDAWTNECTSTLTPTIVSSGNGLTQVRVLSGERFSESCVNPQADVKTSFFIAKAALDQAGIDLNNLIIINSVKR